VLDKGFATRLKQVFGKCSVKGIATHFVNSYPTSISILTF